MPINYDPPLPEGLGANPSRKLDVRAWFSQVSATIDANDIRATRFFWSRADAVTYVAPLPPTISHVLNLNGGIIEVRDRGATGDDPLYDSGDRWAVIARLQDTAAVRGIIEAAVLAERNSRWDADEVLTQRLAAEEVARAASIRDAGVIPTRNVTGTADAIIADLADSAPDKLSSSATIELIPTATNTGAVTLALPGYRPWPIYRRTGEALAAGDLKAGASYLLRRRSNTWRVVGLVDGDVDAKLSAEVTARDAAIQTRVAEEAEARVRGDMDGRRDPLPRRGDPGGMVAWPSLAPLLDFDAQGRLLATLSPFAWTDWTSARRGEPGIPVLARAGTDEALVIWTTTGLLTALHQSSLQSLFPESRRGEVTYLWGDESNAAIWRDPAGVVHVAGEDRFATKADLASAPGSGAGGTATGHSGANGLWPNVDAFDVTTAGGVTRYASPQFRGETRRYALIPQSAVSIADVGKLTLTLGVGQSWLGLTPAANLEPWHAIGMSQSGTPLAMPALTAPQIVHQHRNEQAWQSRKAMEAVVGGVIPLASIPMSNLSAQGLSAITEWATKAKAMADQIGLPAAARSLLLAVGAGDVTTDPNTAAQALVDFVGDATDAIAAITQQGETMFPLLTQFSGDRAKGDYAGTLAIAGAEMLDPMTRVLVVTPLYPFPLAPGEAWPSDAAIIDIAALGVLAMQSEAGDSRWYCPRPIAALRTGTSIAVDFLSATNLVEDSYGAAVDFMGFRLRGATNGAAVIAASISGKTVTLTLDKEPTGTGLTVDYAYGSNTDKADGFVANRAPSATAMPASILPIRPAPCAA